jgi:hypothetical protein
VETLCEGESPYPLIAATNVQLHGREPGFSNVRFQLEALANVFMVKAVELDIRIQKFAKGLTLQPDLYPQLFLLRRLAKSSKNSKANPIETGERSGGIGEICSVEVDEK